MEFESYGWVVVMETNDGPIICEGPEKIKRDVIYRYNNFMAYGIRAIAKLAPYEFLRENEMAVEIFVKKGEGVNHRNIQFLKEVAEIEKGRK